MTLWQPRDHKASSSVGSHLSIALSTQGKQIWSGNDRRAVGEFRPNELVQA